MDHNTMDQITELETIPASWAYHIADEAFEQTVENNMDPCMDENHVQTYWSNEITLQHISYRLLMFFAYDYKPGDKIIRYLYQIKCIDGAIHAIYHGVFELNYFNANENREYTDSEIDMLLKEWFIEKEKIICPIQKISYLDIPFYSNLYGRFSLRDGCDNNAHETNVNVDYFSAMELESWRTKRTGGLRHLTVDTKINIDKFLSNYVDWDGFDEFIQEKKIEYMASSYANVNIDDLKLLYKSIDKAINQREVKS